jgi:hypothetical protein
MQPPGRTVAFRRQNGRLLRINAVNCAVWQTIGARVVLD